MVIRHLVFLAVLSLSPPSFFSFFGPLATVCEKFCQVRPRPNFFLGGRGREGRKGDNNLRVWWWMFGMVAQCVVVAGSLFILPLPNDDEA